MSQSLGAYLPQDRLHALARGETLPEHAAGTVLFADISGFTPLTEALNAALGPSGGAEALYQQINQIYTALVSQVEAWHGSVIGFAGDALTCWFDSRDGLAAPRAAACALALQKAIATVNQVSLPDGTALTLGLKVALASGSIRRLVVGDPRIQQFDALAGQTLSRAAAIEHLTKPGEVLLDQETAQTLGSAVTIADWRDDPEHHTRYARLADLAQPPAPAPWPALPAGLPSAEQLRPWLLPAVAQRYQSGLGDFLTGLRPLVGMFVRFVGIDYDSDGQAGPKLDSLTRAVQQILARYEGTLLQLTIGDKGSSFYAAFGTPVAHEDDLQRALQVALEIQQTVQGLGIVEPLQIGISQGSLIVGAYGAASRLTYAALGDEINLAARLMMQAVPGETLVGGRIQRALVSIFVLEPRAPLRVKGKAEPLPVVAVLARRRRRAIRLEEPDYALPMVGRDDEVRQISQVLERVAAGSGQVLAITGEAGMGKSRLVAELIRMARQHGFLGYGGACQATGATTPYLVWESIWRAFFDIDPEVTPRKQARALEGTLEDLAPEWVEVLPLLGPLLGLNLPDNDFTKGLLPKDRQGALHAVLRECLAAAAREACEDGGGLLLVLEDLHWIDSTSLQLLGDLVEAAAKLPVLFVLAYREKEPGRLPLTRLEGLPLFAAISLDGLESGSSEHLIRAKLSQLFPARSGALPSGLVARLTERAQGNPFYLEELLNYLHDRAIDPYNVAAVEALALPESVYSVVLSRLDQLSSQQQALLKMASVIGRRFLVAWLDGAFANLRPSPELQEDLAELARTDLTAADISEPETAYLFKHVMTQQVVYHSLSVSTRAVLHERLAEFLERWAGANPEPYLDLLAYHYDHTGNREKQRYYHTEAGKSAARRFANDSAVAHFSRVLELLPEDALAERFDVLLERGRVYETVSDRSKQSVDLYEMARIDELLEDASRRLMLLKEIVTFSARTGDHSTSIAKAQQAVELSRTKGLYISPNVYRNWGMSLVFTGKLFEGIDVINQGLEYARSMNDRWSETELTPILSYLYLRMGNFEYAMKLILETIAVSQEIGNRREEAIALICLPYCIPILGMPSTSNYCSLGEQGLKIARMIGDLYTQSWGVSHLGAAMFHLGRFDEAKATLDQGSELFRLVNNVAGEANHLRNLGAFFSHLGLHDDAEIYYQKALDGARKAKEPFYESTTLAQLALLQFHRSDLEKATVYCEQALQITRPFNMRHEQAIVQTIYGHVLLEQDRIDEATSAYEEALSLRQALKQPHLASEPLAGLARIALRSQDADRALAHAENILPQIDSWNLVGTHDPLDICQACYEALSAAGDERAHKVLHTAHAELQRRASSIDNEVVRSRYLARPAHARIIEAHKKAHS
jgi:class 3 adenylate cyclase/tetratricopeptide (TPR) repeat protein